MENDNDMDGGELPQDILALCKSNKRPNRIDGSVRMAEKLICESPVMVERIRGAENKELEFVKCVDALVSKWNPYGCIEAMDRYLAEFENPSFNIRTLKPL